MPDQFEYMKRGLPVPDTARRNADETTPEPGVGAAQEWVPDAGAMPDRTAFGAGMPGTMGAQQPGTSDDGGNIFTQPVDILGAYDAARDRYSADTAAGGVIDRGALGKADRRLNDFRARKVALESRLLENERWYRLMHWSNERRNEDGSRYKRNTGWLFNAIDNKHADFMDNYPDVTVLPRELSDEQAAKDLSAVIPVILKRNGFKHTYSQCSTDKIKNGSGIYHVYWDTSRENGLGDIAIDRTEPLNLFWEPGINNIQDSSDVFLTELCDNDTIIAEYEDKIPDISDHLGQGTTLSIPQYMVNGDGFDTTDKSYIINWYYKVRRQGRTVVHYCKYVNDVVLYASENDPNYKDRGWYDHGLYPFVFDNLYSDVATPFGFGLIDANRDTQEDIDELNSLLLRNAKQALRRRYFVNKGAGINQEEFADLANDFVHVNSTVDERNLKEIDVIPVNTAYIEVLNNKIQELKEVASNRDVTAGSTGGGVQAASAIAALQETGNKTSRAMISKTYEAFSEICTMVIELIRQFYDAPRFFRITNDAGQTEYKEFDANALRAGMQDTEFGMDYKTKDPVFDLDVKAYKQNPWSKAAQNQDVINFYNLGFFAPQNDMQSLAALELLDFEGKEKVKDIITRNGQTSQLLTQFVPIMLQATSVVAPDVANMIAQQLGLQPPAAPLGQPMPGEKGEQQGEGGEPEKTGSGKKTIKSTNSLGVEQADDHPIVRKARDRAAATTAARG